MLGKPPVKNPSHPGKLLDPPKNQVNARLYLGRGVQGTYMCAIPACEEFITEFCEFPFLSPNSVHASSPFSVNHIFFHWIQWHFWPWFFCSYNFALNSVNFLAPTWSLKKKHFVRHHYIASFPPPILVRWIIPHWFWWRKNVQCYPQNWRTRHHIRQKIC